VRFGVGVGGISVSCNFEGGVLGGEENWSGGAVCEAAKESKGENAEVKSLKSWNPVLSRVLL